MSLRSFQDVERYRRALEETRQTDYVAQEVNNLARRLELYWNNYAIPLGRIEGMAKSYMRTGEFRIIAKYARELEENLRRFIELREKYSEASHELMREIVYDDGYGLQFIAVVTGVKLGRIQDIARKNKSATSTIDLLNEILKIYDAIYIDHALLLGDISASVSIINRHLGEADLDPVWDEARIDPMVKRLVDLGASIAVTFTKIVIGTVSDLSYAVEHDWIEPEDQEYYEDILAIVEHFGKTLPARK